ncbi:MAG: Crp/Fnr family transcriptional regulator [Prolixibacteraceae bacterium]|jgi:CRP/FNR family transcriptional regulator|nr:Crp/Fnr family transcriptional regulator [Prolixibacteraceae bacterium]
MDQNIETKSLSHCSAFEFEKSWYDLLTEPEKLLIDENSVSIGFKKGETVCKLGAFASHIYFLEEGLVKVYLEEKNNNLILMLSTKNNLLGLAAVYDGNNKMPYSISTYTDSKLRMIDIQIFRQLLKQNSNFAYHIINLLNESTAQIYGRFYSLTQKQLHGRLADILLCLSNKIFKSRSFDLPLSRADLGDLTGMSTESVIRMMNEFKKDGLIDMECKKIELLDVARLERISEFG